MMQICDRGVRLRGISAQTLGFVAVAVVYEMGAGMAGAQSVSRRHEGTIETAGGLDGRCRMR